MPWLLRSAMCDLMPPTAGLPGLQDTAIDAFLARLWRETTWLNYLGLWLGALFFVVTPVMTVYVPLPSFWLPAGLRARHADAITRSSVYLVRQPIFLLKMYACMCWGQDAAVRRHFHCAPYPEDPGTFRTAVEPARRVEQAS